ncbi:MAG: mannonate dehydratase [Bryobacteraceae bacterium]|jgi:mannonate dehydratase
MKVGTEGGINDAHLAYLARFGIKNIGAGPGITDGRLYATVDELNRMRDVAGKHGISVDLLTPPSSFLYSNHVDTDKHPAIMLGESPQRDRDIESFQTLIKNSAAAGVPAIKYNLTLLGVLRNRNEPLPGRGDTKYRRWNLKRSLETGGPVNRVEIGRAAGIRDPELTRAGRVTADMAWERITYFLERVIPVAEEYKIRMACHPEDPGVPPEGYQGVCRVLGTVEGLKKFIAIKESPYHGLNFCQGTVSEMLQDPGKEIYDVIRYFGSRKKIFNVHFRNIRGHRDDFVEVFPDEGDVDMVKAMQVYKEVGYPYMLMPDHAPQTPADPQQLTTFAFCFGYIRALIQAVDQMAD